MVGYDCNSSNNNLALQFKDMGGPFACRLSERQTQSGGLNGRPEKLEDVSQ